jgi:hypothetical protein
VNKSNRYKAILYALALLVFGGIIGAVVRSATSATPQSLRLGREDEIVNVIFNHLDSKLALTAQQKERIEPLVKKTAAELEASHFDCLKRVNLALDKLHEQIGPELLPEQREKLQELEAERTDRMWEKYRYHPGATNATSSASIK